MKLFVDDIRDIPDESWTLARTINAAITAIDTFDFEVISLDHDISHKHTKYDSYPCNETYTAVAYFIREKYKDKLLMECPKIIIHTSNPSGAVKMAGILHKFIVKRKEAGFASRRN